MEIVITVFVGLGAMITFIAVSTIYDQVAFREVKVDENGWIAARPGPVSYVFGAFSAALAVSFCFWTFEALITASEDRVFFLLVGPPMTALMAFGAVLVFWTRVRASENQVSYRGLRGWKDFEWDDVLSIDDHSGLGPRLRIKGDRIRYFWPYGYGWSEIRNLFADRDIHFSL